MSTIQKSSSPPSSSMDTAWNQNSNDISPAYFSPKENLHCSSSTIYYSPSENDVQCNKVSKKNSKTSTTNNKQTTSSSEEA